MVQPTLPDPQLRAGVGRGTDPLPPATTGGLTGRLRRAPFHPLLFAAFPILALFARNAREVRAAELPPLLAWAAAGAGVAWLMSGLLLRDAAKGALVTSAAVAIFYTAGFVTKAVEAVVPWFTHLYVYKVDARIDPAWIVGAEFLVLCGTGILLGRRAGGLGGTTRFLNVAAAIAVLLPIFQALAVKGSVSSRPPRVAAPLARLSPPAVGLPDIYYLILDGYARHDVLKSQFDLDDSGFLEHLERKGFYVARGSTANYCQTPLCLSASLNGTYIDEMVKGLANDQTELKDFIVRNDVFASLRPLGYRTVAFATGFEPTENTEADRYLSPHPRTTEFQRMVIDLTPARLIWPDPGQLDRFRQARERVDFLLDHLPDPARDPRPTFTFAHLLCPHPPIIFGPNGEDIGHEHEKFMLSNPRIDGRFRDPERFRKAYRDQAAFIARRVQETIDRILAMSPQPPVIIVQSDHGSELELDPESVENTNLHERMSILNAFYFPGGRQAGLYDSISPVNTFRVVFNAVFGARLPMLPDRSYFSTWPEPYRFIDVTGAVRPGNEDGAARPRAIRAILETRDRLSGYDLCEGGAARDLPLRSGRPTTPRIEADHPEGPG